MTPESAAVAYSGVVAALGAALVLVLVVRSLRRAGWRLLGLAIVCGGELVVLGLVTDAAGAPFLIDVAAAAAVVLALLLAAADAAGAGSGVRWLVPAAWGVIVLPATTLAPLLATAGCAGTPCALQDFGATLPLAIAPAAFVLLAPLVPRTRREELPELGAGASLLLGGVLWAAFVVWIAAMEGLVDAYTPVLLLAGAVGPAVGAVVWLIVDRLRRNARPAVRSLAFGALAGVVATMAGAATVRIPWSVAVALLAGLVSAVIARGRARSAARAGWAVLAAALIGLLAPVISGESVGVLYTAQIEAVPVPLIAAGASIVFAVLVSLPVWVGIRARARR
jgi:hypothetical protein